MDFFIELKFCKSDFYSLNSLQKCKVANYNFDSVYSKTPIPLDGDSATIRNFGQNDADRSRNGKSVLETQKKRSRSAVEAPRS